MDTAGSTTGQGTTRNAPAAFNWLAVGLGAWLIFGLHLDGWAHHQFELESFFTPWHGVLYLAFLALAILYWTQWWLGRRAGLPARLASYRGYEASLLGVLLFLAGGVGDGLWHVTFGIEVGIEALVSPTHLLLALGGAMMVTGPLRAAVADELPEAARPWVLVSSLALLLSLLTFFTAYANPMVDASSLVRGSRPGDAATAASAAALGLASLLIQGVLMTGAVLFATARSRLPLGALTLLFTFSVGLSLMMHSDLRLLPYAALAGAAGDLILERLSRRTGAPWRARIVGAVVPVLYSASFLAGTALTGGVWWSVHLWTGAVVIAGAAGWLLATAMTPPRVVARSARRQEARPGPVPAAHTSGRA